MNYDGEIQKLLEMKDVWGNKFKEINDGAINEIKEVLRQKDKERLQRILYIIEDKKELQSDVFHICMGGVGVVLAIAALAISALSSKNAVASTNVIFLLLVLGMTAYTGVVLMPRNGSRNKKIKCLEIAIKELLQEGLTVEEIDEGEESETETTQCIEQKDNTKTYQVSVTEI